MAEKLKKNKIKKTKHRSKLSTTIQILAATAVWSITLGTFFLFWLYLDLPKIPKNIASVRQPNISIISVHGNELANIGSLYNPVIKLKKLPKSLKNAVLATEDRRFYHHFGIDFIGVARALHTNLSAGRIVQGGSTITQQLAKNLFLEPKRSYKRKIQELMLALWIEHTFSKDQILSLYLNRVYLGAGTYGVEAASQKYFDKSASALNTWQSALLAGLLKAPSRYNPLASKKLAEKRARQVLTNMVAAGYLTEFQSKKALKKRTIKYTEATNNVAPYFIDWVLNQVQYFIGKPNRDLLVITTLDDKLQLLAEHHLKNGLTGPKVSKNSPQAAFIAMDKTGAIRSMIGGRDYSYSQFNRSTQAYRQPGSAFKPIVFLSGLEAGMTPLTVINDKPVNEFGWKPENFDKKYRGPTTLIDALAHSINTVAVRVCKKVGLDKVIQKASVLGIQIPPPGNSSVALGTAEVSPLALTTAYAAFANDGKGVWPHGILEIKDSDGVTLYRRYGTGVGQIMSSDHALTITKMLESVIIKGTGKKANIGRPVAGKTGTSQNFRDAWFVGYTPNLIASIWLGNDDNSPMKSITGGGLAAMIWGKIMNAAHQDIKISRFEILNQTNTQNLVKVDFFKKLINKFSN